MTLPDASTIEFTYDTDHRLITKTDPRGVAWNYAYGLYGAVSEVQLGDGSSRQYRPKTSQNLLRDVPPGQGTESNPAAPFAEPEAEVDRGGGTVALNLTPYGKRRSATLPGGGEWTFTRDAWGEVTDATGPEGRAWEVEYDDDRRVTRERIELGVWQWRETRYTYAIGRRRPSTIETISSAGQRMETRTYDALDRLLTVTDPSGAVTSRTWNGNGRLATVTEPGGRMRAHEYDSARNRVEVEDSAAAVTRFFRNTRGEVVRVESPELRNTEFEYDVLGRMTVLRAPSGAESVTTWQTINDCPTCEAAHALGLVTESTDPDGRTTTTSYNALGRVATVDRPMELDSAVTFDPVHGRPLTQSAPGGYSKQLTWNARGLLTSETETGPNGNVTRTHLYDGLGRRVRTSAPLSTGTTWEYGLDDELMGLTVDSPHWSKTYYTQDGFGDLKQILDPDLGATHLERDGQGRIVHRFDSSGRHDWRTYAATGDLVTISGSGGGAPSETMTFTYDAVGRRLTSSSAAGTTTVTRDGDGLVLSRAQTTPPLTHTYDRDIAGHIVAVTGPIDLQLFREASGTLVGWMLGNEDAMAVHLPDGAGRDWLVWNPPTMADADAWFQLGLTPTGIADLPPLGRARENTYGNGRLLGQELRHDGITLHSRSYDHGPDGRVTEIVDSLVGTWTYAYDDLGRLTGATLTSGMGTMSFAYTYDSKDNRLSQTVDGATTTYAFNVGNRDGDRLLSSTDTGGTTTYTYDSMGRPLTRTAPGNQVITYAWDVWGRLRTVSLPDGTTATYGYDTWGDRIRKDVTVSGTTTTTLFWRDAFTVYETDATGAPIAITGFAEDGYTPVWRQDANGAYYYHTDHLGTPILLTDLTGAVVWAAVYEPFGAAYEIVSDVSQPWRFPGQYYDAETGLHYNRQRYYEPATGRYLSPDPTGQRGGENLFEYAQSGPTARIDPRGENPLCLLILLVWSCSKDDVIDCAAPLRNHKRCDGPKDACIVKCGQLLAGCKACAAKNQRASTSDAECAEAYGACMDNCKIRYDKCE